jgi:hypothetical protein
VSRCVATGFVHPTSGSLCSLSKTPIRPTPGARHTTWVSDRLWKRRKRGTYGHAVFVRIPAPKILSPRSTAAAFSPGLPLGQPGARKAGTGEPNGYRAAGFVDVAVRTQWITAVPATLVLQRMQFATATGLRKWAKWDSALDASASKVHFAMLVCGTRAVLDAFSSIF